MALLDIVRNFNDKFICTQAIQGIFFCFIQDLLLFIQQDSR